MKPARLIAAFLSTAMIVSTAVAQDTAPPAPPMGSGIVGTPGGTGAYPAVAEVAASLADHTLYHPQKAPPAKMPIVLWGNGACRDNGLAYAQFLRGIASHGYFVVSAGHARREEPVRPAPAFTSTPVPPAGAPGIVPPRQLPDETQASQLIEGLDWALAENGRKDSPFFDKLDPKAVAVMGHSCGGLQAIAVSADPRIRTSVILSSGVYNRGTASGRSQITVTKAQLADIHGPVAYINGGPADIAYENAKDDFSRIDRVPALFAEYPIGHGGTFQVANGGEYGIVTVQWLDWQLKGDRKAAAMFTGAECGLCRRDHWTVERKRLEN
jgi:dienelactone hydrolase